KTVLAQFDHFLCKFFFRAAAQRRVPALAPEKIVKKTQELLADGKVKRVKIKTGGDGLKHHRGKGKFGDTVAGQALDLFCVTEPCPAGNHSSSPVDSSKFFKEPIASYIRSHSISHSSNSVGFSRSSFTYFPQHAAPSITLAPMPDAISSACS